MGEQSEKSFDLDRIWAVWNRRQWLDLLVLVLPLAAGTTLVLSLPGPYRPTAPGLVERQQIPEAFGRNTVTSEIETRLQTIREKILSRARLEELIARFNLYPNLRGHKPSEAIVERFRRDITVEVKAKVGQPGSPG